MRNRLSAWKNSVLIFIANHKMLMIIIALLPATGFGIYNFGKHAAYMLGVSIITAVFTEYFYEKITHKDITINDLSAVLTGLLFALTMPSKSPLWMGVAGSVIAILIIKQLFGGFGRNLINPALGARCFLALTFAKQMSKYVFDGKSSATPLSFIKDGDLDSVNSMFMMTGNIPGTIGETSLLALILGVFLLLLLGIIDLRIPGAYLLSFIVFIGIFGPLKNAEINYFDIHYITAHLCGGGLMLGAWFMATDETTSPKTSQGQVFYGIILGLITAQIRLFGGMNEGVMFAILIGNLLTPVLDHLPLVHLNIKDKSKGSEIEAYNIDDIIVKVKNTENHENEPISEDKKNSEPLDYDTNDVSMENVDNENSTEEIKFDLDFDEENTAEESMIVEFNFDEENTAEES